MQETSGAGDRAVKAVLFDMDNTLWDFVAAKKAACRAVVEHACAGDVAAMYAFIRASGVVVRQLDERGDPLNGVGTRPQSP